RLNGAGIDGPGPSSAGVILPRRLIVPDDRACLVGLDPAAAGGPVAAAEPVAAAWAVAPGPAVAAAERCAAGDEPGGAVARAEHLAFALAGRSSAQPWLR